MIASNDTYSVFDSRRRDCTIHSVQLIRAQIDQEAAEHEFRHVAEQHRGRRQHQDGDGGNDQAGKAAGAAAVEIEQGAAERNAARKAAGYARQDVGDARDVQLPVQIGLAMRRDFDAGGVEQCAGRGDKDDRDQVAQQIRQCIPWIVAKLVGTPRQHEGHLGRRLKGPAPRLRFRQ